MAQADGMRLFGHRQVREAKAHAAAGGQALHVWNPGQSGYPGAPRTFSTCALLGKPWAHLFDQDIPRLLATARRLGVRRVVVANRNAPGQHVDLCGRPLERAMAQASSPIAAEAKGQ
ncbi:MAG TPA: hypothetical protein VMY35_03735 [Phycisphaerae bacterium]|nr:hypothetical protein [Phycisphaerae bacterium]